MSTFEWDREKAKANNHKHGVAFDEAQTVFSDDLSLSKPDDLHSDEEERSLIIGMSNQGRLLVVVYTERGQSIRLISARLATRMERNQYEELD